MRESVNEHKKIRNIDASDVRRIDVSTSDCKRYLAKDRKNR